MDHEYDGQYICPKCLAECAVGYYCPNGCSHEEQERAHSEDVARILNRKADDEELP